MDSAELEQQIGAVTLEAASLEGPPRSLLRRFWSYLWDFSYLDNESYQDWADRQW